MNKKFSLPLASFALVGSVLSLSVPAERATDSAGLRHHDLL